jgi:diguanylate cyclase (GGDEF)-like protein/PAS domain S-box-containing protein
MKSKEPFSGNATGEVSALIATLSQAGQRLEELTAGQVDSVLDPDGRTLWLRGAREQLSQGEDARQAAILNALPAHIALLDTTGTIVSVNDAWQRFVSENVLGGSGNGLGLNYLAACDLVRGDGSSAARRIAEGIRSVLGGVRTSFSLEYPCHSPAEQRWFQLVVTPLREDRLVGAVVVHINITERMQMEQSVQHHQKRLRDIIDGLGPSIFVGLMTPQGVLIEANRPALSAAGLKPADVLGKPFEETHWWSYSGEVQRQLHDAIVRGARGEVSRYDVQVRGTEGHLIDVDFSLQPMQDETGKVVFLVPSASVITERKRTENALRESNQKFEQLVSNITDVFWIRSPDLREVHYVSPAFEQIWGRSVESLYANPHEWSDFILAEDRERVLAAFATLTGEARSVDIEYRIVRPDREIRWVRVRGFQVRDASDKLIRTSGIVTDITGAHRAQEALRASLEEFRTLAEAMPQMIWIAGPDGRNIYFNQQWMDYTGLTLEESLGHGWNKPFHSEDHQRARDAWLQATATKNAYTLECRLRRADGVYRWWLIRGVPLQDASGMILKWFGTCTDIHDLKLIEEALYVEKESAQIRLNSIGDSVFCTDIAGRINFLNSVAEGLTGWSLEQAKGRPIVEILRIKDSNSGETASNQMDSALLEDRTLQLPSNCVFLRRNAVEVPIEGSVAPIHGREGQLTGAVIVVRDVSAARAMTLQMTHLAEHDSLTGLPNRLLLNDRVSQAIASALRHQHKIALLFLDLDGFKHINDSLGHPIGDKLLQSVGHRLVDCVRATDTVSRQGGDEFIVLLSEVENPEDAAISARRMLLAVAEPQPIDLHELHVTTSIGLSVYPDDGLNAETLIKNADTAMYQAKENGRQSYQFFKPAMNARAVERQSIEESLRRALERQEFAVHYQPKINLSTGQITGAEALIRWTHPTRGPVSPAQFIPIAEDSGLIVPIGSWVLREACKQLRAWADAGLPTATIAVNVSAMEFRQETFLEDVFGILQETGVDPKSLELELTESVLMKRAESVASVLQELRARGVQIAVDDFGTGYSSLSYLRKFPIDALKIDQSFIRQITATPDDATIVSAIISMGRSMNLRVIAEGVETQEELAFLQAHQCHEAQGYYFSKPVLPRQFAKLLETGIPLACRNAASNSGPQP